VGDSVRYPDAKQFKINQENSRIFLPKLGGLRYRNSREILGSPKSITVSSSGGIALMWRGGCMKVPQ
jgi:putative transposase